MFIPVILLSIIVFVTGDIHSPFHLYQDCQDLRPNVFCIVKRGRLSNAEIAPASRFRPDSCLHRHNCHLVVVAKNFNSSIQWFVAVKTPKTGDTEISHDVKVVFGKKSLQSFDEASMSFQIRMIYCKGQVKASLRTFFILNKGTVDNVTYSCDTGIPKNKHMKYLYPVNFTHAQTIVDLKDSRDLHPKHDRYNIALFNSSNRLKFPGVLPPADGKFNGVDFINDEITINAQLIKSYKKMSEVIEILRMDPAKIFDENSTFTFAGKVIEDPLDPYVNQLSWVEWFLIVATVLFFSVLFFILTLSLKRYQIQKKKPLTEETPTSVKTKRGKYPLKRFIDS